MKVRKTRNSKPQSKTRLSNSLATKMTTQLATRLAPKYASPNPVKWMAIGLVVLGGWVTLGPAIIKGMGMTAQVRDIAGQIQQSKELLGLRSDLADDRLTKCTQFVFNAANTSQAAAITDGLVVVDPVTGRPIADGSILCDVSGSTAVVTNGVASDVAVSNNHDVGAMVQAALAAKGLHLEAGDPNFVANKATVK